MVQQMIPLRGGGGGAQLLKFLAMIVCALKVAVGHKRSTNRNLKQVITIQCTKTVIFQLLRALNISKLAKRAYTMIYR